MKAIVAVDQNWGIGYLGELLERIPEDMKLFKQTTLNKVVIMGRETFESLPGREPLKDRTNIILSKNGHFDDRSIKVCRSLEELLHILKEYFPEDVFAIGGESVYRQLLPYCTEVFVTKIEKSYKADKYFINLDENKDWRLVSESATRSYKDIRFKFTKYANNKLFQ